ncbi:MAG: hypothetical protein PHE55_09425 [Methylococcaceae bacterium]|nr:hypothetical protein [Methylococcaceae bacterium]
MSLITDATSTLERLTKLRTASEDAQEARELETLSKELAELASPVCGLAANFAVFRSEGVALSAIPDFANVIDSIQKTLERFQQAPKATTLRQGRVWTTLVNKLQTLAQKAQSTQVKDWQYYFDHQLFGGLPPAKRESTLAKTPQNKQALEHYRELYQKFIKYRQQPPTSSEEFNKLCQLSKQLANITFQEDVPEDVRKFLDALGIGADLHLLTPDVLNWLRDNGLLGNYVVRARIN